MGFSEQTSLKINRLFSVGCEVEREIFYLWRWLSWISGYRRDIDDICALLGCYAASCSNCLLTFRIRDSWPWRIGLMRCPESSVSSYRTTPRNVPEERRSHDFPLQTKLTTSKMRSKQNDNTYCPLLDPLRNLCWYSELPENGGGPLIQTAVAEKKIRAYHHLFCVGVTWQE
jgi:hypothetical protein